jgi:ABC-2 type transport system permease protein
MRGLLKLTWLELKIFIREPMGVFGSVGVPALLFIALTRAIGPRLPRGGLRLPGIDSSFLPVLSSLLLALSAIVSLVTIISIYREGGILRRLSATPLRPHTILTAHVLVKLLFTAVTLTLMMLAGRRMFPPGVNVPYLSFAIALLICTLAILSMGFVIASLVPTARFAQPIGAVIFYPMIALSGLFVPLEVLPGGLQMLARMLPLTYVVSLLRGIWTGGAWTAHLGDLAALAIVGVVCLVISSRVFRWQ